MSEATEGAGLAAITAHEGTLEVRHPRTGEVVRHDDGRPYTITLLSRGSQKYVEAARAIQDRRAAAMMRTRQLATAIMSDKEAVELLVAATVKWDLRYRDDKLSQPKPENYRTAYLDPDLFWMRQQVDEFVGNDANFF